MSSQGTLHQIFPSLALLRKQRASCSRQTTWDDLVSLSEPSGWGDKKKKSQQEARDHPEHSLQPFILIWSQLSVLPTAPSQTPLCPGGLVNPFTRRYFLTSGKKTGIEVRIFSCLRSPYLSSKERPMVSAFISRSQRISGSLWDFRSSNQSRQFCHFPGF